jgi:hypothetical protein
MTNKTATNLVLNGTISGTVTGLQLQSIGASVAASALTISASALSLEFRSATLGSGTVTRVSGTPANLVISSGSTLGTVNGVQSRIAVLAINNAGTIELAAVNVAGGNDLSETGVISTTAEGGAGAADSASVVYSTTARSNLAYRVIGYIESTQATAGTWATAPSTIQGNGGRAQQYQMLTIPAVSASGTSVDFTGIPSWVTRITVLLDQISTNGTSIPRIRVGGGSIQTTGYLSSAAGGINVNTISAAVVSGGFDLLGSAAVATTIYQGRLTLIKLSPTVWTAQGSLSVTSGTGTFYVVDGTVVLTSTPLDRVRLTTVNGTDSFDNGSMALILEG